MEYYNYIKSLHLIFVITWFAGLFYIPRLFIYHIEAQEKPVPERTILSEQLKLMARRLWYIISWPSAILATSATKKRDASRGHPVDIGDNDGVVGGAV